MAARPTGMLAQKMPRQPTELTRPPPSTGPRAMLRPSTAPQTPIARARSARSVKVLVMMDMATGLSTDPPTACSTRKATSQPRRSPIAPASSMRLASTIVYAAIVSGRADHGGICTAMNSGRRAPPARPGPARFIWSPPFPSLGASSPPGHCLPVRGSARVARQAPAGGLPERYQFTSAKIAEVDPDLIGGGMPEIIQDGDRSLPSGHPRPWWSRPVHTDVWSLFARMSRYGPVAGGITRHPVSRFSVQPGRSQHFPALSDTA
jgi:hypothetical protein